MTAGFSGEVAEYYAKYRRGYPPQLFDALEEMFALGAGDVVLDLGCGTGQLTVPLASRVGSVIAMDPEPDMLRLARESAALGAARNVTCVLGGDTDVPALGALLGPGSLAMTVVGTALHWMRPDDLFPVLLPLFRARGGIAVVANGAPLWHQDTPWSRALRAALERHFGRPLRASCGTDPDDRRRYERQLEAAGYKDVREIVIEYRDELSFDQLLGGVYSATSVELLPAPEERTVFAARVRQALGPEDRLPETVRVSALVGRAG
ncbi:class I SAM-dependent methyltransferase [Streptomyces sp. ACA25]|uniref:class I SAM-dependent methyltransferase n=1 Tax=Streptomyces sp. ACA25 TaxID=3022596 RepID=UPI0023076431|nr:class I SAM-dependent methyltransferase [Streptomyces sp. ACA25]MDB1089144.1 class I SAM-dependent methyltransferase [Streptomyces sp. ACA25]